ERQIAPGSATLSSRAAILTASPMRSPSVAFFDHVPEMNADPKFNALVGRDLSVALDHRPLDFNGAIHCVDNTPELDSCAIPGALNDPAVVHGDGRIDQVASEPTQARKCPVLVCPGEPAVADDICDQDCCEFPGLHHWTLMPSGNLTRSG